MQCTCNIHEGNEGCIQALHRWFFIVYLDVILIFSIIWKDHIKHVKTIFELLKKEKLYIKLSKCEFAKTSLVYLGYIVGNGQVKINPTKVEAIVKWPKPTTTREVRSFLGAVQYWRKFIANFSYITTPLHALTSVKHVFQWGDKQCKSFKTLKEKIIIETFLALSYLQKPFEIKTDARRYGMGTVLMQRGKPICYHSETFTQVVINYPTYDNTYYMRWYNV